MFYLFLNKVPTLKKQGSLDLIFGYLYVDIFFKKKAVNGNWPLVGVRGFEPPTTRPPDVYSNRAELHPAFPLEGVQM